ncbi:hypothetical protein MmiAt1_08220 [Methanimicrococcus sp. At1]|uniref:Uncharacterized protein n=1 Tax=Methanimicrococcus hacksteinii TaxID=3028293 RepID=A0ABU3VPG1_9EURY|nr:hypothetical protein [Methanimicrococcus sp. At1]
MKLKQFTGENGGNAIIGIPENVEFELIGGTFISSNTSVHLEITCRKDPYQNFEEIDNELKKECPVLPIQKLRENTAVRTLPMKSGYEADIYNERSDQAITIFVGPENNDSLKLLSDMIQSAEFI